MIREEAAWVAWRDDPRPLGVIPVPERAFKDGYRAARADLLSELRAAVEGTRRFAPDFAGRMLDASEGRWVTRAAVLALLAAAPLAEQGDGLDVERLAEEMAALPWTGSYEGNDSELGHWLWLNREALTAVLAATPSRPAEESGMPFTEEERRQAIETGGQDYQPDADDE